MNPKAPNFRTSFRDILLPVYKRSPEETLTNSPKQTTPEKSAAASSLEDSEEDQIPLKILDQALRFSVNGEVKPNMPMSLTIKSDYCRICGDLRYHEKFDGCRFHPRKNPEPPVKEEVQEWEPEPEIESPDGIAKIEKLFNNARMFEKINMAKYLSDYHALKKLGGPTYRQQSSIRNIYRDNDLLEKPPGTEYEIDDNYLKPLREQKLSCIRAKHYPKEKFCSNRDSSYSKRDTSPNQSSDVSWGKTFGFRKGSKTEQTECSVPSSEIWDGDEYYDPGHTQGNRSLKKDKPKK